jgi:hypothetical protein
MLLSANLDVELPLEMPGVVLLAPAVRFLASCGSCPELRSISGEE